MALQHPVLVTIGNETVKFADIFEVQPDSGFVSVAQGWLLVVQILLVYLSFYDPSGGLVASVLLPLSRTRKCETKYSTTEARPKIILRETEVLSGGFFRKWASQVVDSAF
ncbi:hypothetical protein EDB84DRAFT_1440350 [Lactarius hengduanensis]|nr:hypothetical protein EDB84DRAFT_1440350 [Lactarius hengduanensis]